MTIGKHDDNSLTIHLNIAETAAFEHGHIIVKSVGEHVINLIKMPKMDKPLEAVKPGQLRLAE